MIRSRKASIGSADESPGGSAAFGADGLANGLADDRPQGNNHTNKQKTSRAMKCTDMHMHIV
jgi:hypothetical protein